MLPRLINGNVSRSNSNINMRREVKFSVLSNQFNKIKELFKKLCTDDGLVDLSVICDNIQNDRSLREINPKHFNVRILISFIIIKI